MQPEIQSDNSTNEVNDKYQGHEVVKSNIIKEEAKAEPLVKEEVTEEAEDTETDEGEDNGSEDKERKRKRGGGYQKKIARLQAEIAELKAGKSSEPEPKRAELVEPDPEKFTDWNEYQKELRAYDREIAKREALAEFENKQREKEGKKEVESKLKTFAEKQEEARKTYGDYDDALAEFDDVPVNPAIHQAMLESDHGADIAYYLAKNPDVFDKLNDPKLSVLALGRELGKIEASFGNKSEKAAVKVTTAPPPISPVRAAAKTSNKAEDLTSDYEAYRKARGYN